MPLRDHFHPPVTKRSPWDALHGAWPAVIVTDLNRRLPARYIASPRIHLGTSSEIDVAASETDEAVAWAPPQPTLIVATDQPERDVYEILIHEDSESPRRLVAAIKIVSPSNKCRPDHRRTFVAKCTTLLQRGVSVSI